MEWAERAVARRSLLRSERQEAEEEGGAPVDGQPAWRSRARRRSDRLSVARRRRRSPRPGRPSRWSGPPRKLAIVPAARAAPAAAPTGRGAEGQPVRLLAGSRSATGAAHTKPGATQAPRSRCRCPRTTATQRRRPRPSRQLLLPRPNRPCRALAQQGASHTSAACFRRYERLGSLANRLHSGATVVP